MKAVWAVNSLLLCSHVDRQWPWETWRNLEWTLKSYHEWKKSLDFKRAKISLTLFRRHLSVWQTCCRVWRLELSLSTELDRFPAEVSAYTYFSYEISLVFACCSLNTICKGPVSLSLWRLFYCRLSGMNIVLDTLVCAFLSFLQHTAAHFSPFFCPQKSFTFDPTSSSQVIIRSMAKLSEGAPPQRDARLSVTLLDCSCSYKHCSIYSENKDETIQS